MTLSKRVLSAAAIMVALLVFMAGCDVSIFIWDPDFDDDPVFEPGITVTLDWDSSDSVVPELYVTYPAPDDGNTVNDMGVPVFVDPLGYPLTGGDTGFFPRDHRTGVLPNELVDDRGVVHNGNRESVYTLGGEPAIEFLETTASSESIVIRGFPFDLPSTHVESTFGGGLTGLQLGRSYMWVGVMEVYALPSVGELIAEDGDSVDAILTVYQDGVQLLQFEVPANSSEVIGSSLLKIDCFFLEDGTEIYHFNQDVSPISGEGQIRSVAPAF